MRLSDLLGSVVIDDKQRAIGKVLEVVMVQDGPIIGSFGAAFKVSGFIAGRSRFGSKLGLDREEIKGPLPLKSFFNYLHRNDRYVPWERVRSIEERKIRIAGLEGAEGEAPDRAGSGAD